MQQAITRKGSRLSLIRNAALRDTNIVIASVIATNILRLASSVLLTRLLAPEAFGVVGIIGSVSFILVMISDLGFQAFVVRHRDGDQPAFLDAIWTVRLLRATALTLILLLLAPSIAAGFGKPELTAVIAVSSLQFAIEGASSLGLVTALRERQILRLSLLEIVVAIVQLIMSVALAFVWRSYWAIMITTLLSTLLKTALSYWFFPKAGRRFRFNRAYTAELWKFARYVTGSSIISMLLMQTDKLVLARVFPLEILGLYLLASNLALAPLAFTSAYANRVLFPAYARVWREAPQNLRSLFYAGRRRVSAIYMVGAGALIGGAPLLVTLLYDERYGAAADYLRLLGVTPLLALSSASANEVLTASGRVHVTFHANIAKLAWLAIAGPLSYALFGPIGLVAVVGSIELPTLLYSWLQLNRVGLLNLAQEILLLGYGAAGCVLGLLLNAALVPIFGRPA